ncbi:hypothetical protein MOQ72_41625 [Saccharopolyspora sp. K220]|uniref:hypothetical protein n=1 Tax=Saccharopolyspora soli TaxID=2926618 RepID=UPI001F56994E|nr:hypothetical protein [Saccharopolyspora soli]MCI2423920.1 hypothetical protein [Saccharopolyspora soli]
MAVLLIAVGIRIGYLVLRDKDETTTAQPTYETDVTTPATTSEAPPMPGAPIRCEPELRTLLCFPKDYNPEAVMDGVAAEGWDCLRKGEQWDDGGSVSTVRECREMDNVGQPYTIRARFSYETHDHQPTGGLQAFDLNVTTSAASSKGERTSMADTTPALITVFDIIAKHIWRDHPEQFREATDAFNQLKSQCESPAGHTFEGVTVTTPSGYQMSCSSTTPASVGDAITYNQSLEIRPANL